MKKAGFLPVILIVLAFPGVLFAIEFKLRVFDPVDNKPLSDVQVILIETRTKYFTDENGYVVAEVPAPGYYTVRAIIPGGEMVQPRIQVNFPGQEVLVYSRARPTGPIGAPGDQRQIVTGDQGIIVRGKQEESRHSRYKVRLDEIKRIPGQFGEALRGLESLPGVNAPSFGDGDINVRGADDRANNYLVDNLPIGYAFHLLALNSVIANDMVNSLELFTGAYPARYGNATGGIIFIETKDEVEKFGGTANFSLWQANALFKGKFLGEGYWIAAGRRSYLDRTLSGLIPDGIRPPVYWDTQAKFKHVISPTQSLYFYTLVADDRFGAEITPVPENDPTAEPDPRFIGARIEFKRNFHTEALRHIWQPGSRFRLSSTAYVFDNEFFVDGKIGTFEADIQTNVGWAAVQEEATWEALKDHVFLTAGVEGRYLRGRQRGSTVRQIDPSDKNPDPYDEANPDFETVPIDDTVYSQYHSAFAQGSFQWKGFEAKTGARLEYLQFTRQRVVDPRGSLSYTIDSLGTTFTGAGGVHHRLPDPTQLSPTSGNPNLKMERAEHAVAGIEQQVGKRWLLKLEGYRNTFTDIVVTDPYLVIPVRVNRSKRLDDVIKEPIKYNDRAGYSNDGTGSSEGYEVFVKKDKPPEENGWYGWVSYTWSKTLRNDHQHIVTGDERRRVTSADERRILNQYDNTQDQYASFDRTHILNIVFGWKLNAAWQVGSRWKYATNPPYTPVIGDDGGRTVNNGRVIFDPVFSDVVNSKRLEPYHRLDVRVDRFVNYDWGFGNVFLELLNVYLRDNPTSESWTAARPYSRTNPAVQYDFGTLVWRQGGSRIKFPLFNFGTEIQF